MCLNTVSTVLVIVLEGRFIGIAWDFESGHELRALSQFKVVHLALDSIEHGNYG